MNTKNGDSENDKNKVKTQRGLKNRFACQLMNSSNNGKHDVDDEKT